MIIKCRYLLLCIILSSAYFLLVFSTVLNCLSVKWSTRINNAFSFGKTAALILITGFGLYYLLIGRVENLRPDFQKSERAPFKWATAFYYGLFSYDGWFALNNVTEEIKNPRR